MGGRVFDFWKSVDKSGECWIWTGAQDSGYGVTYPGNKKKYAHRYAYELEHGPMDRTTRIEQTCGNKLCVRVEHLRIVTVETRAWEFVHKTDTCWIWTGSKDKNGYGRLAVPGKSPQLAHHIIYELVKGPIPKGLYLLHDCPGGDNPACVNPDHLSPGTQAENMADMWSKNRQRKDFSNAPRGESHHKSHLTWPDVREMRKLRKDKELTYTTIGEKFGIDPDTVRDICSFATWKDDPDPNAEALALVSSYGHRR